MLFWMIWEKTVRSLRTKTPLFPYLKQKKIFLQTLFDFTTKIKKEAILFTHTWYFIFFITLNKCTITSVN